MKEFLLTYKSEGILIPVFNSRSFKATCFSDAENNFKQWAKDQNDVLTLVQIILIS
ncbi:hypothetical protein [Flavobacterium sp.]|jgi:hypothetical protein|uniref:hypothetical protein n=1 Tax=Flavobacterium sp. TaxID=239 RepID=UPI00391D7C5D